MSGPRAFEIASPPFRFPAEVWTFPAPRSVTGEDVAEVHLTPGSRWFAEAVLAGCVARGARVAAPGEFTRRAFRAGRIDLPRAEAVAAVIEAAGRDEARAAADLLGGALSAPLEFIERDLLDLAADVEAQIDFTDQDVEIVGERRMRDAVGAAAERLDAVLRGTRAARAGGDRVNVVLVGPSGAGKSTLFNRLAGARALVGGGAGTTRDLLAADVDIGRARLRLWDTAGLGATDPVDAAAAERSRRAAQGADAVLLVVDAADWERAKGFPGDVLVVNKVDRADAAPATRGLGRARAVGVSAATGSGVEELRRVLEGVGGSAPDGRLAVTVRQADALQQAARSLASARAAGAVDLVAADLRDALDALGEVTGRSVTEEVLGRIFARFCVGK